MGIDIKEIASRVDPVIDTQAERKEVVRQARDAGIADEEIIKYFQGLNVTTEDIRDAMCIDLSNTANNSKVESSTDFVATRSKSDKKDDRNFMLKELGAVGANYAKASDINWDALANDLTTRVQAQNPYIKQNLMNQVKGVINDFKTKTFGSKEAIEKAYEEVKDSIPNDENKSFKVDVLKTLAGIANAQQKEKEKAEVLVEYRKLKDGNVNRELRMKTLEEKYGPKNSFYSEILKEIEESVVMQEAHDEVWDAINRQRIGQVGADGNVVTKGNALTDKTDIEKAIRNDPNLTVDKYTRRVMRGRSELSNSELVHFERSTYKANRASAAADNQVKINRDKSYTEENFKDNLKHDQIFNVLVQKGWIEEGQPTQDGKPTYTLAKLSDEIGRKVGAETAGSPQKSDYIAYSEVERILLSILAEGGDHTDVKMSKADVIGLMKMCGYPYNGTSFLKKLWDETGGALADLAITTATAFAVGVSSAAKYAGDRGPFKISLPYNDNVPVTIDVINNTHLKMTFTSNNQYTSFNQMQFLKDLMRNNGLTSDDITFEQLENGFSVVVDKNSKNTVEFMKKISGVAEGEVLPEDLGIDFENIDKTTEADRIKGIVTGLLLTLGLLALRAAMRQYGELPVETTQFESNDYNKYVEELNTRVQRKTLKAEQRDALLKIADTYVKRDEQGNVVSWDAERYRKMLNKIAGDGSFLNKFELAIGADKLIRGLMEDNVPPPTGDNQVDQPTTNNTVTTPPAENADPDGVKYTTQDPDAEDSGDAEVIKNAGRYGWENLGKMYSSADGKQCFDDNIAFRAMQIIQAIDPQAVQGRYDADVIKEITSKAFPYGRGKPNWNYINTQLKNEYPMVDVERLKAVLNSNVSADNSADRKVVAPLTLYSKDGEFNRGEPEKETPVAGAKTDNNPRFSTVTRFTKTINGKTHYFIQENGKPPREVTQNEYNNSTFKVRQ